MDGGKVKYDIWMIDKFQPNPLGSLWAYKATAVCFAKTLKLVMCLAFPFYYSIPLPPNPFVQQFSFSIKKKKLVQFYTFFSKMT